MDVPKMINFWMKSSEEDLITAEGLYKIGRFLPCLFYCHLFIEKAIKGLTVKDTGDAAPYDHKLSRLVKKIKSVKFTKKQLDLLDDLTAFNIKARYEDYKFEIYKKATKTYTKTYLDRAKELYLWLKGKK